MNQEQNNLNPNNFKTQGNNGIPDNQPLNQNFNNTLNQNVVQNPNVSQSTFNQQPINPQPQLTPSFQQPIMQESTPKPVNNAFESGIANNQNLNSKPPKKMSLGLIIGIVITVVAIVLAIIFLPKLFSNKDKDIINQPSSQNGQLQSTSLNWDKWELIIDNKSITLPMKYEDFINLGFEVEYSNLAENIDYHRLESTYSMGTYNQQKTTYTNGKTNGISLTVYNPSEETILVKDSIIIGIEFVSVNNSIKGDIKLINHTKNTEVTFGVSSAKEIEEAFGQHYQYDSKNNYHYYPNSSVDASSTSIDCFISLNCYGETGILNTYGFYYADKGNSKDIKINKSPEKYKIPSEYKLTHQTVVGVNKTYRSNEYIVETLEYWKFDNEFKQITKYLENKSQNVSMGKLINNNKYGEIFVLEYEKYHYENRYSYYVLINDGEYFLQVVSLAKTNAEARIGYEKAVDVALQFLS